MIQQPARRLHLQGLLVSGASRDRTGDLLLAKQSVCPLVSRDVSKKPCKSHCSVGHGGHDRTARDNLMHPWCTLSVACVRAAGSRAAVEVRPAASAGGGRRAVQGRSRLGNRRLRGELRRSSRTSSGRSSRAESRGLIDAALSGAPSFSAPTETVITTDEMSRGVHAGARLPPEALLLQNALLRLRFSFRALAAVDGRLQPGGYARRARCCSPPAKRTVPPRRGEVRRRPRSCC